MKNQSANNSNKTENPKRKESSENQSEEKDRISSKTAITVLSALVFLLLGYIILSRVIEVRNTKLSDEFNNFITDISTEEETVEYLVNINTDDIFELTQLSGIGQAKALAIIEYRKENGDFVSIEELRNVPGIGDAIFEKIKDRIYIKSDE